MTQLTTHPASYATPNPAKFFDLKTFWTRILERRRQNRTLQTLRRSPNRMLRDVGLTRSEIECMTQRPLITDPTLSDLKTTL